MSAFQVHQVEVPDRELSALEPLIGHERYDELRNVAQVASHDLSGRTVWNVNSTASGGGVAEMLQVLIGYTRDAGIDARWLVMSGDADFFAITKRIHNRLHGVEGDGGELGKSEAAHYTEVAVANAASLRNQLRHGDIVLLHDPQTAPMALPLVDQGAVVVWRCHVGRDSSNDWTDQAWSFLRPHLDPCRGFIFSLPSYIPSWMDQSNTWVIPPSIDPFSPKNQQIGNSDVLRMLGRIGLMEANDGPPGAFTRRDGTAGLVERRASIISNGDALDPDVPLVIQVSRWDKLKDMAGVMAGFASGVAGNVDAQLALVGPAMDDVTDDPEEAEVFAQCVKAWHALSPEIRRTVRLVALPMDDVDENAAMVNALQRHATVVVQKSLAEGFGLTVAEAMWKSKAVVASAVGGIREQLAPGTGISLDDPTDLEAFGDTLRSLLDSPDRIAELGANARRHVLQGFVGDKHLIRYAHLMASLVAG